jgi:hypothetical protein
MPTPKSIKKRIRIKSLQTELILSIRRSTRTRKSGRTLEDVRKENCR